MAHDQSQQHLRGRLAAVYCFLSEAIATAESLPGDPALPALLSSSRTSANKRSRAVGGGTPPGARIARHSGSPLTHFDPPK
eukprot:CAMPEP_0117518090 /NCGR_PEP_ID=MMETSP0784-20121206/31951_1 /TAXON_ID=39447 /ORGANISM="" /LENGTH=80 /DNA_ID=CAMNT_0005313997 /DNA_START=58 /DNA_END=300 /DNA_ORIENTATION=-